MKELDEQTEAERQHGEVVACTAIETDVYSAADKAGVMIDLKGLLASRATSTVLASLLSRRLGGGVHAAASDDEGFAIRSPLFD